jgi:hypothetical protein
VLVDVLPPLIPSVRPKPSNCFDVLFTAWCFDTTAILDALIGYAARALLRSFASLAVGQRDNLACQVPQEAAEPVEAPIPASWFRARVLLAMRALPGTLSLASVQDFFAMTSVRAFRDLTEALDAVAARLLARLAIHARCSTSRARSGRSGRGRR